MQNFKRFFETNCPLHLDFVPETPLDGVRQCKLLAVMAGCNDPTIGSQGVCENFRLHTLLDVKKFLQGIKDQDFKRKFLASEFQEAAVVKEALMQYMPEAVAEEVSLTVPVRHSIMNYRSCHCRLTGFFDVGENWDFDEVMRDWMSCHKATFNFSCCDKFAYCAKCQKTCLHAFGIEFFGVEEPPTCLICEGQKMPDKDFFSDPEEFPYDIADY
jgi:hypothetical protein